MEFYEGWTAFDGLTNVEAKVAYVRYQKLSENGMEPGPAMHRAGHIIRTARKCTCGVGMRDMLHSLGCPGDVEALTERVDDVNDIVPALKFQRIKDVFAFIAAELMSTDGWAVRRALYAAELAVELNLSAAQASEMSTEVAWDEPQASINANVRKLVEEAGEAADAVYSVEGDGGRFFDIGKYEPPFQ